MTRRKDHDGHLSDTHTEPTRAVLADKRNGSNQNDMARARAVICAAPMPWRRRAR